MHAETKYHKLEISNFYRGLILIQVQSPKYLPHNKFIHKVSVGCD